MCIRDRVNAGYTHMEYQYERVYSNMVRMADRIQQTEGYYAGIPVMISNSYAETLIEGDQIDTTGPVSYTHLDVYKRQVLYCGSSA